MSRKNDLKRNQRMKPKKSSPYLTMGPQNSASLSKGRSASRTGCSGVYWNWEGVGETCFSRLFYAVWGEPEEGEIYYEASKTLAEILQLLKCNGLSSCETGKSENSPSGGGHESMGEKAKPRGVLLNIS